MIIERLIELRKSRGLKQYDLAQYLKITRQAYSAYESDKREMDFKSLCLLADFYDVSTDYLLGRYEVNPLVTEAADEIEVVRDYRLLDERGKENVKATLAFEVSRIPKTVAVKKLAI